MLAKALDWVNKNDRSQLVNSIALNYLADDTEWIQKEPGEYCQLVTALARCAQLHRRTVDRTLGKTRRTPAAGVR
jgi:ActR/RegA family two-component response regulator